MNEEGINSLRPLIETPEQVYLVDQEDPSKQVDPSKASYLDYKNKFIAIKWKDKMHEVDDTRAEFFYNICYIDNVGKYHELGSSKVLLEILQDYFRYIGNIDEDSGEISFVGD